MTVLALFWVSEFLIPGGGGGGGGRGSVDLIPNIYGIQTFFFET